MNDPLLATLLAHGSVAFFACMSCALTFRAAWAAKTSLTASVAYLALSGLFGAAATIGFVWITAGVVS